MTLRVMWPSHCQDHSGWVIGWAQDDCVCIATVIPKTSILRRVLLEDKLSPPFEGTPRTTQNYQPPTESINVDAVKKKTLIGIHRFGHDARRPTPNPPSIHGTRLPKNSTSLLRNLLSHYKTKDQPPWYFSYCPSSTPSDLQEKIRLLNLQIPQGYWGAKLQILGYYDMSNVLITKQLLFVFGSTRRNSAPYRRPKILYYRNHPTGTPPHQIILYTQPNVYQFYPEPFEWQKICFISHQRTNPQKKIPYKNPVGKQKYLNSLRQINASQRVEWSLGHEYPLSREPNIETAEKTLQLIASRHRSTLWYLAKMHALFVSFFFQLMLLVQHVLDYQFPLVGRLADVGLLGPYITSRIDLWLYVRRQWTKLDRIESHWKHDISAQYDRIRMYNAVLAISIDWILGLVVNFLIFNYIIVGDLDFMNTISKTLITWIHEWLKCKIQWITAGSPGGIKLNVYAASSFGSLILFYIDRWLTTACELSNLTPYVFLLVTCSGMCGLSTLIAMAYDSIYFLNMQTHWMYKGTTKIYRLQLIMLRSLWLLFRGKKRNVLRDRINLCDYSLDQLILGIFLFITTFYLISTCLIFYLLFVYVILLVLLLRIVSLVVITTLNHFPYYQLALYLTGKGHLLTGVYLKPLDSTTVTKERTLKPLSCHPIKLQIRYDLPKDKNVAYYELKSTNTKFWHLFADLRDKVQNVFLRYNVKYMLNLIVLGRPLG